MNSFSGVGRLTRDPEIRVSNNENQTKVARFSIAINRRFKKENEPEADFINCVAFGKTAEFIEKFFKKGMAIGINGRIQTGSYTNKDGVKVYTTDIAVENAEFVERKADGNGNSSSAKDDSFMNVPDTIDETLPFN